MLEKNINLNNVKNVATYKFAFGDKDEKSVIYVSEKSNLCAMNRNAVVGKIISEEQVSVETVDTFLKDKALPKLIRMDVEGYEYEVFKGMTQTLKENVRILVELHPWKPYLSDKEMDEIFEILEKNNFKVQFAVFEDKVLENGMITALSKKIGSKLPIVVSNISISELKELIHENFGVVSPNVIFEKQVSCDRTDASITFRDMPNILPAGLIQC